MRRRFEPKGPWISKASAQYPFRMNAELCLRLGLKFGLARAHAQQVASMVKTGLWGNSLVHRSNFGPSAISGSSSSGSAQVPTSGTASSSGPSQVMTQDFTSPQAFTESGLAKVQHTLPLRGQKKQVVAQQHVGDLRHIWKSTSLLPGAQQLGPKVRRFLMDMLEEYPDLETELNRSVSLEDPDQRKDVNEYVLEDIRFRFASFLRANGGHISEGGHKPVTEGDISSSICGQLLHQWSKLAGDPGADVALWIQNGAPANVRVGMPELSEVMPMVADDPALIAHGELSTDYDNFCNHGRLEDDKEAVDTIMEYVRKGYLKSFPTLASCESFLGEKPVLSKFACLTKDRFDPATNGWKTKRRIILDSKESNVKAASAREFRSVLPRVIDVVHDTLACINDQSDSEPLEYMVLDASDAFWEVPLDPRERKFYSGLVNSRYLVYLRTAQGSRGAPLAWSAIFGLVCRMVQSLFFISGSTWSVPYDVLMNVYVDDPIVLLRGNYSQRCTSSALVILAWRLLGINLAYSKAQYGESVDWIAWTLSCQVLKQMVICDVRRDRLDELYWLSISHLASNCISFKDLRTYVGKAQSMASLIYVWRPFLSMIWAALFAPSSNAPTNCVWTKQVQEPLSWILAFLARSAGSVTREFHCDQHFNRGEQVVIYFDASTTGFGAWLALDHKPRFYTQGVFSELDCRTLNITNEQSKAQQAFEALALLIALRLWLPLFRHHRTCVRVRGDNLAALSLLVKMQPHSPALQLIARELALEVSMSSFTPDFAEHVAGISNTIADTLSRRQELGSSYRLPTALIDAEYMAPERRNEEWWLTKRADAVLA